MWLDMLGSLFALLRLVTDHSELYPPCTRSIFHILTLHLTFDAAGVSKTGILKLIAISILFLNLFCRSDDVKAFFEQLRAELTAT